MTKPDSSNGLIGTSLPNVDGRALVTGRAKYTVDLDFPGMVHGKTVRSTYAHALITAVDTERARRVDGVLLVITGEDITELGPVANGPILDMLLLATGKVRYVGEPVAVVIGVTEEAAQQGADLVEVTYEPLPHVLDPEEAMRDDAPLIHEGLDGVEGNVCWTQQTKAGDIDAALAEADLVISKRLVTTKAHAMPMETHAAVARYDDASDTITLWTGTQGPHLLRNEIARVFGYPQTKVRVIKPYMGGAFGHKEGIHTNEAMAIWAARALRRPVRIELSRTEEFAATVSRNPHIRDATIAVRNDGTVLGWKETIVQDVGAYSGISPAVLALSEWVTVGPYKTPALDIEGSVVYTNKPPSSAFRGFGNPQATFAREVMFDIAARELGIDPLEFRYRNVIRPEDLPTATANGLKLVTLPIEEATDAVAEAMGYQALLDSKPPWRGVGVANMLEWGGGCRWHMNYDVDMNSVKVEMNADGSVVVATDAADSGQGHATIFTQIVSDRLGVDPSTVTVRQSDTDTAPFGLGTFASRTAVVHGSALMRACDTLRERMMEVAGSSLEADPEDLEIAGGQVRIRGTNRGIPVTTVAALAHYVRSVLPDGMECGSLVASASYDAPSTVPDENGVGNFAANYTTSSTMVIVDVDPTTGKVTILDWASAEDVGRALNPDLLKGQLQGGVAQGIGFALGEDLIFDESGTVLNPSMADYQVPTAPQVPLIEDKIMCIESFDPTYPLQHKGIGESGIPPAAAAIANAVFDAIGVPITTLPITPEKVLAAIESRRD
ncbi:MAG: xanthine dehydrogenase family protein molybdopterin-binding subunit [bacterium]|nr:xanthine dehydrogenase family protein molybdopterin-binding subunit [bacterium]